MIFLMGGLRGVIRRRHQSQIENSSLVRLGGSSVGGMPDQSGIAKKLHDQVWCGASKNSLLNLKKLTVIDLIATISTF
jgi:hypothetical protein